MRAAGSGPSFEIVPVAVPLVLITPPDAFDRANVSVSSPSSTLSLVTGTVTVFTRSPSLNVSVPLVDV